MVSFSCRISPRTSTVILRERSPPAIAVATSAMLRTWPVRLPAIELTLSVRSFQAPVTPGTCAWPPRRPSVPTSRATRVTSPANALSWSTIVLIVFFSSRISPCTSTVTFLERSPLATAVVTSAMLRTWPVRLPAMKLTLSVRSFQTPPTPLTSAWPPRRPSVPTSRATRVTSLANALSWSTIVLMVFLSSRISPRTSTVIFFDRSPCWTAVVTSAMLRTWLVRLPAMEFTLSVRSFQTPPTPSTLAWPPSLPSVPTSRATRVTSLAKALSWSTMTLIVCLSSRISPWTSTVIFLERSPCCTAVVTSAMLRTWLVRLPAMKFTLSVRSFQTPPTPSTLAWPPSLPSVPTSRATRVTSLAKALSWSTMTLIVCLSSRISPWTSTVIFLERSPCWTAVVTSAMLRTWLVRLPAMEFTLSVRSFQTPPTPSTLAWPPSLPSVPTSRATRVTSLAKALSWSTMTLIVCLSSRISPWTSTVIFLERSPCWTAVVTSAMLRTWLVRLPAMKFTLSVMSFQTPPTPSTLAWPPSLPSVPTSRATRVTSLAKALSWSTMTLIVCLSSRISPWTSTVIFLERSPCWTAVVTSAMLRTWLVRLPAMEFTLSVRSFQTPPTPSTLAWPPSLPSVPTSRATRVTSLAKALSWSTMTLIVCLSSRISPWTSTVIFFDRSPCWTAVVTSAMLRTWLVRLPAMEFTLSVRSFQTPPTPSTLAWPPSLPSVPTSRATRVTSLAKALSWSTMTLIVCLSSRISPWTSTVIFLERSPCWTAVVTSAMLRTWLVRLPAMEFTLSVRSFQTPPTPSTLAWPPSLPSVPTSRATRVTSLAKALSWSTMTLIVCLSSRISPWTSTVIFLERSPCCTAVVTSAMLRTWLVRLPAMKFTLSVRSFQTPPMPRTCAWPPSLPSVPTSRATRVTSEAKPFSWSTITLIVFLSSRISPRTSTVIFFERSPLATAVVTSAILRTWAVRLAAIRLTLSVRSFHTPAAPLTCASPPSFPSVPTSLATRVTSEVKERSCWTMALTVRAVRRNWPSSGRPSSSSSIVWKRSPSATAPMTRATPERFLALRSLSSMMPLSSAAILPIAPFVVSGMRTEKLPFRNSRRTWRMSSASSGAIPCARRRSAPLACEPFDPLVPTPEVWRVVMRSFWRRGWLVLGTGYLYTKQLCQSQTNHGTHSDQDHPSLPITS